MHISPRHPFSFLSKPSLKAISAFLLTAIVALTLTISVITSVYAQNIPDKGVANFTVKISGVKKLSGSVRIAIFDNKENWLKKPVHTAVLPAGQNNIVEYTNTNVSYGEYAIAVYHDVNGNGEMDRNFIGLPKEPYGFSNNARGSFGPAKWKKAKISINTSEQQHQIKIK